MAKPIVREQELEKIVITLADGGLRDVLDEDWDRNNDKLPSIVISRLRDIDRRSRGMRAVYTILMRDRYHVVDRENNDGVVEYQKLKSHLASGLDDAMRSLLSDLDGDLDWLRTSYPDYPDIGAAS